MACSVPMGFIRPEWGGGAGTLKRKFRWLFNIENITVGNAQALPCLKAGRPKFNFREMPAEHLNETINYPSKPDWQPVQISLYDRCLATQNPIFSWLKKQYDPTPTGCSNWFPCIDPLSFKPCCILMLLDGCGEIIETWTFEHCYPQNIDWGELDMNSNEYVTVDFSLRYDRAFQTYPTSDHALYQTTSCVNCTDPPDCGSPTPSPTPSVVSFTAFSEQLNAISVVSFTAFSERLDAIGEHLKLIDLSAPDFTMIL